MGLGFLILDSSGLRNYTTAPLYGLLWNNRPTFPSSTSPLVSFSLQKQLCRGLTWHKMYLYLILAYFFHFFFKNKVLNHYAKISKNYNFISQKVLTNLDGLSQLLTMWPWASSSDPPGSHFSTYRIDGLVYKSTLSCLVTSTHKWLI